MCHLYFTRKDRGGQEASSRKRGRVDDDQEAVVLRRRYEPTAYAKHLP